MRYTKNKGFTLIELLLGITIAVMIFLTASSVLALLFRSDIKTKKIEELEQTKNDLFAELSNKIRWAEDITFTSGTSAKISIDNEIYTLDDGRVLKGTQPLTPLSVKVTKFEIKDYSNDQSIKSLEISIDMESETNSAIKQTAKMVTSQRKTIFEEKN